MDGMLQMEIRCIDKQNQEVIIKLKNLNEVEIEAKN